MLYKGKIRFVVGLMLLWHFYGLNTPLHAQYPSLYFKHITTSAGLPHTYLFYSIIQDSRGFMWFGSENGLHRYDGVEFTNYYHDPEDSTSISGNAVFHIMEDLEKNLWIATNKGVNIYDWDRNAFRHIPFLKSEDSLISSTNCYSTYLLQSQNKNIYLSTNNYLYQYDTGSNLFVPFGIMQNFPEVNRFGAIRTMVEDKNGNLWLSTQEKGLHFLDLQSKKVVQFSEEGKPPFKILSNNIASVCIDSGQEIWVASDKGLNRINIHKNSNTDYVPNPGKSNSLSHKSTNYIYVDDLENIWVGTDGGGLNLFDRKSNSFLHYTHQKDDETSLLGDKTKVIYKNRQGLLWVTSIGRGINFTNLKNAGTFHTLSSLTSSSNYLADRVVTSVIEDDRGNLWIGTDGDGLDCYNLRENTFLRFRNNKADPHSLPSNSVTSLYIDKNKDLWVGTYQGGLSKFNPSGKSFTNYLSSLSDSGSIFGYSIYTISEDDNGNILAAGHNSGINILDRKHQTIRHLFHNPGNRNSVSSNYILTFYTDHQGIIWIGTYHGLSRWDKEAQTFTNFFHSDFDPNSLSHNWVYSITEDAKHNLWIGTAGGLNLFNRETRKFKLFSKKDGFVNDVINGIIEDNYGNLWMSTNGGLVIFNPATGEIRNYDKSDGLPGNEFMKCAYHKGKNGEMYFGNTKGLVYFLPENIKTNTSIPPVYITDFYIENIPVAIGQKGSPLKKQIIVTEKIILRYDQTFITFKYAALNYDSPEKNQYAYYLEGFDKDWHYVGNERKATYSSLEAGKYTFRVKGSNNNGLWNEAGASVQIVVLPPWWKTWWFKLFLVLFTVISVTGFFYYRFHLLHRQKQELEQRVLKRTEELNKTNTALEKQSEKLRIQTEDLKRTNALLIEKQKMIEAQKLELLHSNQRLAQINATKDKLFSVLGHDLKAPFNVLLGFGTLLIHKIDTSPAEHIKKNLGYMNEAAHKAYELVENLLNWARAQRGAIDIHATEVNVKDLLEDTVQVMLPQSQVKNITLKVETAGKEEAIFVDEVLLGTILRNIISNAIKFSNKDSQIHIKVVFGENQVEFSVADQGIGISLETKERLFEVSNVVSKPGTNGEKGTGLGLLVCSEFVNLLKGRIWVESELNAGTTFYFTIPN